MVILFLLPSIFFFREKAVVSRSRSKREKRKRDIYLLISVFFYKEHDISLQEYNRHTEEILENNIHSNNHVNSNNAHHNIHGGQTESSPHRNNVRSLDDDCFNKILDYLDTVHLDSTRDQEWVRLARIIDRLCFVVFGLGYVILFIVFLSEIYRCINGECSDD